jgi:hypothetical protein
MVRLATIAASVPLTDVETIQFIEWDNTSVALIMGRASGAGERILRRQGRKTQRVGRCLSEFGVQRASPLWHFFFALRPL